ncbi:MAG: radical SAM protein [Elusimicrobia bacterium]|nr:radical SAM protein [Elusimicrobiota bacterium]
MTKDCELVQRLRDWLERAVPQGPHTLHLSPTMACDLNCLFCRRQDGLKTYRERNTELSDQRWLELADEALSMGVRFVFIKGGGEPLLRRELMRRLVPLVKVRGACGHLVTNGTHIDDELARLFVATRWDQVTISLDGPDAATHDFLRARPGVFDSVMAGLARLRAAKAATGSSLPRLAFHCVLTKANHDRLAPLIELAHREGVEHLELDSMSLRDESARHLLMTPDLEERFSALLPDCLEKLGRYGISHNFDRFRRSDYVRREAGPAPRPEGIPCFYPWYQASITPGGSIVPCCYAEETHRSRANLNTVTFRQAWEEGDAREYRAAMAEGKLLPFCKDCTTMYADNNSEIRRWLGEDAHARR